jgi:peptidoglycan-N-acetylglucosamine deacetylase
MEKRTLVTTSWDDGDRADLRLAKMLAACKVAGTFYVPVRAYGGRPSLTPADLKNLSAENFEIGAHSVNHKLLWGLSPKELADEIDPCKPFLEDILGKQVRMFCYPCGRYDANVIRAVQKAGYQGARTVRMLSTRLEFNRYEMPTTVQIMPHAKSGYIRNVLRARKIEGVQVFLGNMTRLGNWLELSKSLFDSVLENGGIWHLYGHSHEIDKLGLWQGLEEILNYVGNRKGVTYVPNGDLIPLLFPEGSSAGNGHSSL